MIRLVEPCERYLKSYIDAYDEYSTHGVTTYCFDDARAYDIFEKYDNYKNERNLKPNRVGADYYWLVDDERDYFIGEISIRHRLTEALEQYGGHIGYGVRYSEWNKGYGTLMLKFALEKAQDAYTEAFKQLTSGKGNISKRLNELKELGLLTTTKRIPDNYISAE